MTVVIPTRANGRPHARTASVLPSLVFFVSRVVNIILSRILRAVRPVIPVVTLTSIVSAVMLLAWAATLWSASLTIGQTPSGSDAGCFIAT